MKLLVTGSRSWTNGAAIELWLHRLQPSIVMHGGAVGADRLAGEIAERLGIVVEEYPADWRRFGNRAGFVRNKAMLSHNPDMVLAFWDGQSRGTAHMIRLAEGRHIPVQIVEDT